MDVGNGVLQFQRTILSASIQPAQLNPTGPNDPHQLYIFQVNGLAFLYHQVRSSSQTGGLQRALISYIKLDKTSCKNMLLNTVLNFNNVLVDTETNMI